MLRDFCFLISAKVGAVEASSSLALVPASRSEGWVTVETMPLPAPAGLHPPRPTALPGSSHTPTVRSGLRGGTLGVLLHCHQLLSPQQWGRGGTENHQG